MKWLIAVVMFTACDRRPAVTSCASDLHGVWLAPSGRWAVLDYGKTLEAFTLFDDRDADLGGAPRVIDVSRDPAHGERLAGEVRRRYSRGAEHCDARATVLVTTCEANELRVVIADPQPPLSFAPCSWGTPVASRVERWQRD